GASTTGSTQPCGACVAAAAAPAAATEVPQSAAAEATPLRALSAAQGLTWVAVLGAAIGAADDAATAPVDDTNNAPAAISPTIGLKLEQAIVHLLTQFGVCPRH
ncbi:MAG TPA: hypothetical protein VJ597_06810, partial [Sphingomicrobium sp.]|nr:hypothetical protein [Sphingomicrobium sp.]